MTDVFSGLNERDLSVFDSILKSGSLTKNDLLQRLDLKMTTLGRSIKQLEDKRLIVESGTAASTGGRKPAEYGVTQNNVYTIGVDVSRTYVKIVLLNLKLKTLGSHRFEAEESMTPQSCTAEISDAIERLLSESSIPKSSVIGIGVGTVGPMDRKSGELLEPQGFPNPSWNDKIPLRYLLREATGLPCEIDNGANTAVLAEYLFGLGRGYQSVAYIHCGVGVRSAVIRDGTVIRTMNDSEDAFAHMTIDIHGSLCKCGNRGCLENAVSLEAVRSRYCSVTGKTISYKGLFSRATGGDTAAIEALKISAKALGVGISNLAKLMNPELVILSGPLVSNFEPYYSECIGSFQECISRSDRPAFSKEGSFKEDIVAIGAGLMVLEKRINQSCGFYTVG